MEIAATPGSRARGPPPLADGDFTRVPCVLRSGGAGNDGRRVTLADPDAVAAAVPQEGRQPPQVTLQRLLVKPDQKLLRGRAVVLTDRFDDLVFAHVIEPAPYVFSEMKSIFPFGYPVPTDPGPHVKALGLAAYGSTAPPNHLEGVTSGDATDRRWVAIGA